MTVVVTGAAGFIGRHVVATLVGAGHDVVGVDRRGADDLPVPLLQHDLVARHDDVRAALGEAAGVIHLAGRPGVRDAADDVAEGRWHDNVLAGEAVLADVPAATPVVVASSSSVYGGAQRRAGHWAACREDQPLSPRGGYARSKVALEEVCAQRRAAGGSVTVVRPFTVVGEGQRPDMALATWIGQARRGVPMTVLGSLRRRRDVTDVHDVAAAMVEALLVAPPTTINLGTGRTHTLDHMTRAVAAATGVAREIDLRAADPVEVPATRADTRRCVELLGLLPTTDLADVVERQVAAHPSSPVPDGTRHMEPA